MSIEYSHGKPRNTRPRLREVPTGDSADARRRRNHAPDGKFTRGNAAAAGQSARRAIAARERATLAAEIERSAGGLTAPSETAALLQDVLRLYTAAQRAVQSTEPIVLASCMAWARATALASLLTAHAVQTGVTTPAGLALLEAAQRSEQRAERASVHAATLAERLARPAPIVDVHARVLEAFGVPAHKPKPEEPTP